MNRFLKRIGWPWFSFCKKKKVKNGDNTADKDDNEIIAGGTKSVRKDIGSTDTNSGNDNSNNNNNNNNSSSTKGQALFYQLEDNDEWEDLINDSKYKDKPIFVYFTAEFSNDFFFFFFLFDNIFGACI